MFRTPQTVYALCLLLLFTSSAFAENPWEPQIQQFEAEDTAHPFPTGGIVFMGSSSIRMWDTDQDFPQLNILNRGFGGSETSDALYFVDRTVIKHAPRLVVLYEGDNDIDSGKSPETVFHDTKALFSRIQEALPKSRIIYIAIKPSLLRWKLIEPMRQANALVKAHAQDDSRIHFLDIDTPMIGNDGMPRKEFFIEDGLHLNKKGYALWKKLLHPYLISDWEDLKK